MDKKEEISLVTTYMENKGEALKLMHSLVSSKLAACANIFETHSCFLWNDELNQITEYKIVAKTNRALEKDVFDYISSHHPYEVPYIVMQRAQVNSSYAHWLNNQVMKPEV